MDHKLKLFMQLAAEKKIVSQYEEQSDTESSDDDIINQMNKLSLDTEKCYIEGTINNNSIKFIIDSNITVSTIPMKILEKYNIDINPVTITIFDQNITYSYNINDNKYCVLGMDVVSQLK